MSEDEIKSLLEPYGQRLCEDREWALGRFLGAGATAATFEVVTAHGLRALKIYLPSFLEGKRGDQVKKRLSIVLDHLKGHDCPYLVSIFDGGPTSDTVFLLMQRAPGECLGKVLYSVPSENIREIIRQVSVAAHFLEEKGLCHRDIKSDNVVISDDFKHTTLLDLGVVRWLDEEVSGGTDDQGQLPFIATAQYSSPEYMFRLIPSGPELWRGLTYYQLGGLLHDLIMKKKLFADVVEKAKENRYLIAHAVATKIPAVIHDGSAPLDLVLLSQRALEKDQLHAINGLPPSGKHLLLGPPGSGKTSILLHRGQYLRLAPHNLTNVRLITFTRTLREFIAVNGDERFPPELIQTVKGFVDEIFKIYNAPRPSFPDGTPLSEQNKLRAAVAFDLIKTQGKKVEYDALLIDEIQDLSSEEIELFDLLSDRVMMVGDIRQKLFEAGGGLEAAEQLGYNTIALKHHFRISREIARVANSILLPGDYRLEEYCHYRGPTPSTPVIHSGLNASEQLGRVIEALDLQLDAYNDPSDMIGIVAAKTTHCDAIKERLDNTRFGPMSKVFHSDIENRSFAGGQRICVVTTQSCKGLEFRALHWLMPERDTFLRSRERAYTVVTRAKSSLAVYYNDSLPSYLAGAFPAPPASLFEDDT